MRSGATFDARPMGPAILCPHCGDRVPLESGSGPAGGMTWICRNGHEFAKRASRPPWSAGRVRLVAVLP